ncbi:hypothetical protein BB561_005401 [Smittium simulii]|uniref:Origin recognition complex subunit 2 n=1 Tax=Smittium simulii TaxID=133385 RepID=A0A2T9YAL3_9FUNG|nr:hypothetical protein BB561_005401 [Smittium simulii]
MTFESNHPLTPSKLDELASSVSSQENLPLISEFYHKSFQNSPRKPHYALPKNSPRKNFSLKSPARSILAKPPPSKQFDQEIAFINTKTQNIALDNMQSIAETNSLAKNFEEQKTASNFNSDNVQPSSQDFLARFSEEANNNIDQGHDYNADESASLINQDGAESYFLTFHKAKRKIATSNNTLALLAKMKLENQSYASTNFTTDIDSNKQSNSMFNHSFYVNHKEQLETIAEFYRLQYKQWAFELQNGFNLLFYGYGSKKSLLYDFCMKMLSDKLNPVIVINGFYPNLNFKNVLEHVVLEVLAIPKKNAKTGTILDLVKEIDLYFLNCNKTTHVETLVFLVHNIDGICLRKDDIQSGLSALSSINNVHLVASADHINAPLLWDSSKLFENGYNFIWHNLSTFENYIDEINFETYQLLHYQKPSQSQYQSLDISSIINSNNSNNSTSINIVGLHHVMASLTSNAKNIFLKLANYQIDSATSTTSTASTKNIPFDSGLGMEYFHLYNLCKESFLVSNEITFRSLLTEFKDHNIITFVNEPDGSQILYIPLHVNDLKIFVDSA